MRMSIGGLRGSEIPVETEAIENVEKTRVHGGQKGVGLVEWKNGQSEVHFIKIYNNKKSGLWVVNLL